ncbi:MAG: glycosyltransferase family 2 protein [Solirubrobacteraceae bacterium]
MAPTISVILPSRDRPIEVRRAAATVIAQTFTDWELVIVDDGSDPAADVVGLEALDPRITVLRNDVATGVSRARNRGIAAAQAPWLAFLDDDDVWHPTKLAAQLAAAERRGATFIYTSATVVESGFHRVYVQDAVDDDDYELALLHTNVVRAPSSVMVRAAAMAETDGFDPELSVVADWDMWLRLNEHVRATAVPEPLTGVIEHPDSMQLQLADQIGDELRHLHARHDSRARERGWRFGSPAVAHWHSQKLWAIHRTPWRGAVYGWNVLRCNGLRGTVGKLSEHRSWQRAEAPDWVRTQLESPVVAPVSGRHGLTGARTPQSRAL